MAKSDYVPVSSLGDVVENKSKLKLLGNEGKKKKRL